MIWKRTALQKTFCLLLLVGGLLIGCTATSPAPFVPSEAPSPAPTATAIVPTETPTVTPSPTPRLTATPRPTPTIPEELDVARTIRALDFDTDNNLWVASTAGIYQWHYNPETQEYDTVENSLIRDNLVNMLVAPDDSVWVATFEGDVLQLTDNRWITHTLPANLDMATIPPQMLIAQDNSLWVAGLLGGVLRYNGKNWESYAYAYSAELERTLEITGIVALFETVDGKIWVITSCCDGPSVFRYWDNQVWIAYDLNESNHPYNVYEPVGGKNGVVWFRGTWSNPDVYEMGIPYWSVEHYDYNSQEWIHFFIPQDLWDENDWIWTFTLTSAENIWVGSRQGRIAHFDGIRWQVVSPDDDLGGAITTMVVAPDGTLWVGTHTGILAHLQGETWILYKVESGIRPIP